MFSGVHVVVADQDVDKLLVIIFPRKYWCNSDPAAHWVGPCQDSGETGARPKQASAAASSKKRKLSDNLNRPGCSNWDYEDGEDQAGDGGDRPSSEEIRPGGAGPEELHQEQESQSEEAYGCKAYKTNSGSDNQ